MSVDSNGNTYMVGSRMTPVNSRAHFDLIIYKYNAAGVQQSSTVRTATQVFSSVVTVTNDSFVPSGGVAIDNQDNVYVSGWIEVPGDVYNTWAVKFDSAGTVKWAKESNQTGRDVPAGMTFSEATEEVVVVGSKQDVPFIFRFSSDYGIFGAPRWGTTYTYYLAVDTDSYGSAYITGRYGKNSVDGADNWGSDILFTHVSALGTVLREAKVGSVDTRDWGYGIVVISDNNYVIAGDARGSINGVPSEATSTSGDIIMMKNLP